MNDEASTTPEALLAAALRARGLSDEGSLQVLAARAAQLIEHEADFPMATAPLDREIMAWNLRAGWYRTRNAGDRGWPFIQGSAGWTPVPVRWRHLPADPLLSHPVPSPAQKAGA